MDLLLPLTIIGLFISIYQISEESKRRNYVFKFGLFDKILLTVFALFLVLTIISANFFSEQVSQTALSYSLSGGFGDCDIMLNDCYEITFSFLYSIIGFIISIIIIFYLKLKLDSNKIMQKKKFVDNSLDKLGRLHFSEVSTDLELFHDYLLKSYNPPSTKQIYIFKYIRHIIAIFKKYIEIKDISTIKANFRILQNELISFNDYKQKDQEIFESIGHILLQHNRTKKRNFMQRFFQSLRLRRNRRESYCKLIDNYYYEIISNTEFLEYVAMNNTNLMFMLLDNKLSYRKKDVWSIIGTQLISDKKSKLHKELDDGGSGQTKILDFLFEDVNKCGQWLVWKPIGDYIIQHLIEQGRKDVDEYNLHKEDYNERSKNSTLYSGFKFFKIMVDQALKQNIRDHMWLMYFDDWVECISHNIHYENHKNAEFLNMYEYNLYLIIDCLRNWIKYAEEDESTPENNRIIESAIKSMVSIMETISSSENLRGEFKNYLRVLMIDNYFKLLTHPNQQKMSAYVEKYKYSIKEKTRMYPGINQAFIDFLKYPVENSHNRRIWDRGVYYDFELKGNFIQFLNSLSQESNHDVQ